MIWIVTWRCAATFLNDLDRLEFKSRQKTSVVTVSKKLVSCFVVLVGPINKFEGDSIRYKDFVTIKLKQPIFID